MYLTPFGDSNIRKVRRYLTIPNVLTFSSLALALSGMLLLYRHMLFLAIVPLALCDLFDALDGYVARTFDMSSPLGPELDCLVDVVAFVIPPFFISMLIENQYLTIIAFFYVGCGIFRLARFATEVTPGIFVGLPTSISAHCIYLALLLHVPSVVIPVVYCILSALMVCRFNLRKHHSFYLTVTLVTLNVTLAIYNTVQ